MCDRPSRVKEAIVKRVHALDENVGDYDSLRGVVQKEDSREPPAPQSGSRPRHRNQQRGRVPAVLPQPVQMARHVHKSRVCENHEKPSIVSPFQRGKRSPAVEEQGPWHADVLRKVEQGEATKKDGGRVAGHGDGEGQCVGWETTDGIRVGKAVRSDSVKKRPVFGDGNPVRNHFLDHYF